jgi:uncharacterized protein YgbK (DUF1537 family)
MSRLAIIADDLTGALDAAAPFAARGLSTVVALSAQALPDALARNADVVGVSTDSREISANQARAQVASVVAALPRAIALFKKVDSRLKGNIEAELDALPHRRALVIPAIPAFGRWMREGMLGGFGVTEPIDIALRLGHHANNAALPDIATDNEIDAAIRHETFDLPVGARSLAEAIAAEMAPETTPQRPRLPKAPVYCVIGSTDPITLQQIDALRASRTDLAYIAALNGRGPEEMPASAPLTIIQAVPDESPADGRSVALALSETLHRINPPTGSVMVVSGGATAQIVLEQLGIGFLTLLGEALPGLPIARTEKFTVITKSGGFGGRETLSLLLGSIHPVEEDCV